jgi:hypothetical protein
MKLAVPPRGRAWVEVDRRWTLVVAPPADAPYVYVGGTWVIAPPPVVPGYEWVPGYYAGGYWYPGHWGVVRAPGPGMDWLHGHWEGRTWHGGHWGGRHPHGHEWRDGHRDRHGRWVKGGWNKPPRR